VCNSSSIIGAREKQTKLIIGQNITQHFTIESKRDIIKGIKRENNDVKGISLVTAVGGGVLQIPKYVCI
jgi:hypothetical protein